MRNVWHAIGLAPRRSVVWLITLYQQTLSPDHGALKALHPYGFCRHEPTCSAFAIRTIAERGCILGGLLTVRRLLSCHPWQKLSNEKIICMLQNRCPKG